MAVTGALWLAKCLSLNLNFSFLNRIRYCSYQVATQLYSRGRVDPVPDPILPEKILGYSRESNPGPLGWQSDMLTTIPNRQSTIYTWIFRAYFFWNLGKKNWGESIIWNKVGTALPPTNDPVTLVLLGFWRETSIAQWLPGDYEDKVVNLCVCVCVFQCQTTALLCASGSTQGG